MKLPATFADLRQQLSLQRETVQQAALPAGAIRGAAAALLVLGSTVAPQVSYAATDSAAIGKCVVSNCAAPLARCVTDGSCLANLICIQGCTGKPDESECQIKCGDEFTDGVVEAFTKCAVSDKKCVPQRQDDGSWPIPKNEALVSEFSTDDLQVRAAPTPTSCGVCALAGRMWQGVVWRQR